MSGTDLKKNRTYFAHRGICELTIQNFVKNDQIWQDFNISFVSHFCNNIHMSGFDRRSLLVQMFDYIALCKTRDYRKLNIDIVCYHKPHVFVYYTSLNKHY